MPSLSRGNFKAAVHSMVKSRWRSLMTMMGIIIGIVSVVTIVSIGQGIKQQIADQSRTTTKNLVTVKPGQTVKRGADGVISGVNLLPGFSAVGNLTDGDVEAVQKSSAVKRAAPLAVLSGPVMVDKKPSNHAVVIGTTAELPAILSQKLAYGDFFTANDSNENGAVVGSAVARDVFGQDVPLGQSFDYQGDTFVVRGVFDSFKSAPLSLEADFNRAIFIPYQVAKDVTNGRASIFEILAESAPGQSAVAARSITSNLARGHGGQQDFTVLRSGETLGVSGSILDLLTKLIGAIAIVSLLVGGIGIMNVMLLSVTERMQEIGIRKAVGATSRQIMSQFLMEATVLSVTGGIVGLILSLLINLLLRIFTSLTPALDWQVMLWAVAVTVLVGIIFGTLPALKAARKDPIEALRNE